MDNERIDSKAFTRGEVTINDYYLGDPETSREDARAAAIRQIRAREQLRSRFPGISFAPTAIDRQRMEDLSIDLDEVSR